MSITVEDLMKLPSLNEAKVLAGKGGLSRIVSSISVLEYADPGSLCDNLFDNNEFYGSEIVITGFTNVKDDVDVQYRSVRRLIQAGEVGLILYYVGIFVPEIDRRLIELCNENDFVLICMPEKRMDLRYSEVICEVMEAIVKDHMVSTSLTGEVLEQVSRLPKHQQTVDTVLKILSDRLRTSLLLTDTSMRVLNEAAWPRTLGRALIELLPTLTLPLPGGPPGYYNEEKNGLIHRRSITSSRGQTMELFLLKEGPPLEEELLYQAVEVVQLAVNLFSQGHDEVVIAELVKAILQDEPMKMRRLADIFHVDVISVNTMWIINMGSQTEQKYGKKILSAALNTLKPACRTLIADIYEHTAVILMDSPGSLAEQNSLAEDLYGQLKNCPGDITLTLCSPLADTSAVRSAFLSNQTMLEDTRKLYPGRGIYLLQDILFSGQIRSLAGKGEVNVRETLGILEPLRITDGPELLTTLEVYLLDASMSTARTAELLFLHKNTVKYRIHRISELIGFHPGHFPGALRLYEAAALSRMLR